MVPELLVVSIFQEQKNKFAFLELQLFPAQFCCNGSVTMEISSHIHLILYNFCLLVSVWSLKYT